MPKVGEDHVEARRHQIMDAAASCFCRKGFHHTTMQEICRQSELSAGAVYRYFESKEQIIESMLRERQGATAAIIEAVRGHAGTLQVLDELADVFFSNLENTQACALSVELWAEALRSPRIREMLLNELRNVRTPFIEIVCIGQERGEVNPALDAEATAQVMISFFDGLILQKATDSSVDVRKYVAVMKSMMNGSFWQRSSIEERS
jgi:AcrR family transcriptional regulator